MSTHTKHTPGPWTQHPFSQIEPSVTIGDDGQVTSHAGLTVGYIEKIIADVQFRSHKAGYDRVTNYKEFKANAALILAAPDMLELLVSLVPENANLSNLNIHDDDPLPVDLLVGDFRKIEAVIKKATQQ